MSQKINRLGFATLYKREVWRFLRVANQTMLAPAIMSLLFLSIFTLAWGENKNLPDIKLSFIEFLVPGLIMMSIIQNAFANSSSSMILSKIQGVIIDILMPPLGPLEISCSYIFGGITRGILVGISVGVAMYIFVDIKIYDPLMMITYVLLSSSLCAMMGLLTGIWGNSFDQISAITSYIIAPLAFLSGSFYSIKRLPPIAQELSSYNPFFYMIDGFRYSMTGYSDGDVNTAIIYLLSANIILFCVIYRVLKTGWRLKT